MPSVEEMQSDLLKLAEKQVPEVWRMRTPVLQVD